MGTHLGRLLLYTSGGMERWVRVASTRSATPSRQTMRTAAHTVFIPCFHAGPEKTSGSKMEAQSNRFNLFEKCISHIKFGIQDPQKNWNSEKSFDKLEYNCTIEKVYIDIYVMYFQLEEATKSLRETVVHFLFFKIEKKIGKSPPFSSYNTSVLYISYG
jgi:hypothetical protein